MLRQFKISVKATLLFTVLTGVVYPGIVTGIAQLAFSKKANGSLTYVKGKPVGSSLLGQKFTQSIYFHGRPSATDYVLTTSGGSNLARKNPELIRQVQIRREEWQKTLESQNIPADLLYASGSGLDPHITVAAAQAQTTVVARARGLTEDEVQRLVVENTQKPYLRFIGQEVVNVLTLNLALDGFGE